MQTDQMDTGQRTGQSWNQGSSEIKEVIRSDEHAKYQIFILFYYVCVFHFISMLSLILYQNGKIIGKLARKSFGKALIEELLFIQSFKHL